ncbi:hypothetical protein DNTS_030200 [Danionella cerebrum]|uniref:Ig-like domain-containing protein n=1 Tax=Danionella cerebrum TaxID=2873325 RepID=A0A553Q868_9TELE|nr:hypothetical protein DNTS_030200 [Danionella translucida]
MMKMQSAALILILSGLVCTGWAQTPPVSIRPRSAAVKPGETVSFLCRVTVGAQPVKLEWRRVNNQPLGDNVKLGPDGALLTIANVALSNQGGYRCIGTTPQGKFTATATLSLRQPPQVRVSPGGQLRVLVGESVTLDCSVSGKPRPSISWIRKGTGGETQLAHTGSETSARLQVTMMSSEDAGTYLCRAQNREGLVEEEVELLMDVGGSPLASVLETDLTAVEGQSVTMHCQATGSPAPVISWSKLRAPLPWQHSVNGGTLMLNNLGRQDSGQYICNATNAQGFSEAYVQLEVDSPPYATTLSEEVEARAGDSLRLQCLAHGSHPIRFRWTRVGGASMSPGAESTKDGLLRIAQLRPTDSGTYKCTATNHVGSSEATSRVTVRG